MRWLVVLLTWVWVCSAPAWADDDARDAPEADNADGDDAPEADDDAPDDPPDDKPKIGGLAIPAISANPVDGLGTGLAGEIFLRPAGQDYGYRWKLTLNIYFNVFPRPFTYQSYWARFELIDDIHWVGLVGYRIWENMVYAGSGGADVSVNWGNDLEGLNGVSGPFGFIGGSKKLPNSKVRLYAQVYARYVDVAPNPGGLLDQDQPLATDGGGYVDLSFGANVRDVDRWPVPIDGWRGELGGRVGFSVVDGQFVPIGGIMFEGIGWKPLFRDALGDRLVVGGRLVVEKSFGQRPFFEQDVTAGRWRDELGFEQALSGYGRTRTRGDGVISAAIEIRPYLFSWVPHPEWPFDFYLSLFADGGWLFDEWDPGPFMPSVGFGLDTVFQKAIQLRPFVSWGFFSDEPGGPRRARLQFGIALMDPL